MTYVFGPMSAIQSGVL